MSPSVYFKHSKKKISRDLPQSDYLKNLVDRKSIKLALSSVACGRVVELKEFFNQNYEDNIMKTITTLLIAVAASFSLNANADSFYEDPLYGDPGIGDVFPMKDINYQKQEVSFVKDTGEQVWSVEYEQWVNPADFNSTAKLTVADVLHELETNPPAAGGVRPNNGVFIYDENAGEYQLQ